MRRELNVVPSCTGNTVCSWDSGRKAIGSPVVGLTVEEGTGVPVSRNRGPITPGRIVDIAGHALPSFGLVKPVAPFKPTFPPTPAKNAYARAPQTAGIVPAASKPLMNV